MKNLIDKNQEYNLHPAALVGHAILQNLGKLSSTGALVIKTGKFTGRAPKDRFIVKDEITENKIDWGNINIPIDSKSFAELYDKVIDYANSLERIYVRDAYACADPNYRFNIRVHAEYPWQDIFVYNMFLHPTKKELNNFSPDWQVYAFPTVLADPKIHNTAKSNFAIINFKERKTIIGGTAYTGEIKKGIFSVLNFMLPTEYNILSMHCSANVGKDGDTALFFGLSGTGKTTLSNDPDRKLIGDDEHGWSKKGIFNFEGGCYAKAIDLSPATEPQIFYAIKFGALLENTGFFEDGHTVNYEDISITQNTRVSYPISHIDNIMEGLKGDPPKNIFFLTCDAFGILPPISKLTTQQAMYYFISGYTAKIAGTEEGINEPQATFSACFGAPFLPLNPNTYAKLLGEKIKENNISVWLINTGWTGGAYGKGSRIKLSFTRAMIKSALTGELNKVEYEKQTIFNLSIPKTCPGVPNTLLNPRNTWKSSEEYDLMAKDLAKRFMKSFEKYSKKTSPEILSAGPTL